MLTPTNNGQTCSSCGQLVPDGAAECPRCAVETQDVLPAPPSISGYKLQGLIGRGGMGSVYLAEDQTLGRRTAVKLLSETLSQDEQAKSRFLREARAMATVEHPNIVRVYGFGESGSTTYLVMEYVEGRTLAQRIQEGGRLPVEEALRILKQAVEGLESAWEKGIVHRDIKPANILMDSKGRVRVADFGLAKPVQTQGDSTLSQTGLVLGTPNYMSPEQIQGQKVDYRSDIYSLGIVLYEMLAGERPFGGTTPVEVMSHHLHTPLPDLRQKRADFPEGVAGLLEQMTQKDPPRRPSSYGEILKAIDVLLPETSGAYESIRRHKRRLAVLAAAAALVLLASVSLLLFQLRFRKPQATALPQHRQVTFAGDASDPAITPDGKYVAYVSGGHRLLIQEIAGGQPLELFKAIGLLGLRWSSDGSQLAFNARTEEGYSLFVMGRLGGNPRRIGLAQDTCSWSPDGSEIACASSTGKEIRFVNVSTGVTRLIPLKGSFTWILDIDWSRSGTLLFLTNDEAAGEYTIWTISPDGTRQEKVVSGPNEINNCARWAGAGDAFYYLQTESGTKNLLKQVIDPNSGEAADPPTVLLTGLEAFDLFSVSMDGNEISYIREPWHSNLWLATVEGLEGAERFQMRQITTGTPKIRDARISPDAEQIAFSLEEASKVNIFTMPIQGGPFQQITFLNSYNGCPAWSPDGKQIAFGSLEGGKAKVRIVNKDGSNLRAFHNSHLRNKGFMTVSWAPGTNILYQRPGNRNFSILSPETETETPLVQDDSVGWIFDPCYSPNGKQLAVYWNRKPSGPGLWILSINDKSARLLKEGMIFPIGWSTDAKWVYAYDQQGIAKISVQTAESERMPQIPGWDKKLKKDEAHPVDMSRDEKSFILNFCEQQSDVWVVENFDPEAVETR